jgi:hypothetical protein
MSGNIKIALAIAEPVKLKLDVAPTIFIGTAQTGPQGPRGLPGEIGNLQNMPDASENVRGLIRLASLAEVAQGEDATKAIVPGTLKPELDKKADDEMPTLKLIFENNLI